MGRQGIYEIALYGENIANLISDDTDLNALRQQAMREGMRTLRLSGAKTGRRRYRIEVLALLHRQISINLFSAYCSVSAQAWPGLMQFPLPTRLNSPHATNPAPEQINSTAPPGSSRTALHQATGPNQARC